MSQGGSGTTITRRLQLDGGGGTPTPRVASCLRERFRGGAGKAEDARESAVETLGALWSALTGQGKAAARGAGRRGKQIKMLRKVGKRLSACCVVLFKVIALLFVILSLAGCAHKYTQTLELKLHMERVGHKFKESAERVNGVAETFVDIASLDLGVAGLWENQHYFAAQLANAQDLHEDVLQSHNAQRLVVEREYAEKQLRLKSAHLELVKAKEALEKQVVVARAELQATRESMQTKFAEMYKNVSDSANRVTRAKLRLIHNEETIKGMRRMLDNAGNHNIPDEEEA